MDRSRLLLALAGLSGFLAVCAGAFGAHGVSEPSAKALLQTGGHYQLLHAVAALACWLVARQGFPKAMLSAWLFLGGGAGLLRQPLSVGLGRASHRGRGRRRSAG